jgi:3-deoxy-manno-octulosonate cytidylyltransferase (CMP-KDO synthetase)
MIAGQTMIERVYRRALLIEGIRGAYVATDSTEIYDKVLSFGGQVLMTGARHATGSDRLAEAARILGLAEDGVVLNIQGDQPLLNPRHAWLVSNALVASPDYVASTLAIPFSDPAEIADPNHVKAVFGEDGRALYFSRAAIPFSRDGDGATYYKHIGLYAFRVGFLYKFVTLPQGPLEKSESLEQLRILEHGYKLKVLVSSGFSPEVDTPADVAKVVAALSE